MSKFKCCARCRCVRKCGTGGRHEQGTTHDGVRAFAAWFAEFDDGAPWLANVRNEWTNYVNGRPPSFAGKSRAKRNGNTESG